MLFLAAEMYPMVEIIDYPERFSSSADGAKALRERAVGLLRQRWRVLEANVTGSPYTLSGDGFPNPFLSFGMCPAPTKLAGGIVAAADEPECPFSAVACGG